MAIKRPIDEVYKYVVDVENCPAWRTGCVEGKRFSQGPIGVGTTELYQTKAMGRTFGIRMEVTEYELNRRYSWKATSGSPFPMRGEFTFEAIEGGTRLAESVEITLAGFWKLVQPIVVEMFRREAKNDFSNLRKLLETNV